MPDSRTVSEVGKSLVVHTIHNIYLYASSMGCVDEKIFYNILLEPKDFRNNKTKLYKKHNYNV